MQELAAAGRLRRWPYAIAGRGEPNYYTLTRHGLRILNGPDTEPATKRSFLPVAIARQQHTFALADFVVHTAVAAHRAGVALIDFQRENTVCLDAGGERVYPDAGFTLEFGGDQAYRFYVELDNRTERIKSKKDADSIERKLRVYEAVQDRTPERFRVLFVSLRGRQRVEHILAAARQITHKPKRSLVYGVCPQPSHVHRPGKTTHRAVLPRPPRTERLAPASRWDSNPRSISRGTTTLPPTGGALVLSRACVGLPADGVSAVSSALCTPRNTTPRRLPTAWLC